MRAPIRKAINLYLYERKEHMRRGLANELTVCAIALAKSSSPGEEVTLLDRIRKLSELRDIFGEPDMEDVLETWFKTVDGRITPEELRLVAQIHESWNATLEKVGGEGQSGD